MKNKIIGYYNTKFGELWDKSLEDLIKESIFNIFKDTGIVQQEVDAVFFGNMLGGIVENRLLTSGMISEMLDMHIPIYRLEAACASGGMAFQMANEYLKQHPDSTILVIGAEKMSDVSTEDVTRGLSAASSAEEQTAGLTFPGLYGMMAQVYMNKYGYHEEHLAYISVKNHYHGSLNDKAHFRKVITVDTVLKSPYVAYPLKVLNSSAISDGAAAVLLTNKPAVIKKSKYAVDILSSNLASDTLSLKNRKQLDGLEATQIASKTAFQEAGLHPNDIHIAEVHDCFSIAEIMAMEDLGFWKKGEGGEKAKALATQLGSHEKLVVNTSGGLKAAGHPVGATGVKQIGEVFLQLTGQAEKRSVRNAKYGLAHNVGGSGAVAIVTILGV